jgi:DNA-binding transcriptional MerR regulator
MHGKIHHLPIVDRHVAAGGLAPREESLLKIGELAQRTGKTVRAIHHYEDLGLIKPHKRSKGRFRLYAPDAVERVTWISKLNDLGMSLTQVQEILSTWEESASAPDAMARIRQVYHQKLNEVHEQIARLSELERELHASLQYLDTCETCHPGELVAACSACTIHKDHEQEPELVSGLYATSSKR